MRLQKGVVCGHAGRAARASTPRDTRHSSGSPGRAVSGPARRRSKGGLNKARRGEDIIIGVIDSGIWPEKQVVLRRAELGRLERANLYPKVTGLARDVPGRASSSPPTLQQQGHRRSVLQRRWGGNAASRRCGRGSSRPRATTTATGAHTASTAGGNYNIQPTGDAAVFTRSAAWRRAPGSRSTRGSWSTPDGATAQRLRRRPRAAIDEAVADGVDVINYSISGTRPNFLDPVEVAFLFAADAGVFVVGVGRQHRARRQRRSPIRARGSRRSQRARTTARARLRHGRRHDVQRRVSSRRRRQRGRSSTPIDAAAAGAGRRRGARSASRAVDNAGVPVLDPAKVAGKIVRLRPRRQRAREQEPRGEAGGRHRHGAGQRGRRAPNTLRDPPLGSDASIVAYAAASYAALQAAAERARRRRSRRSTLVFNVPAPITATFSSRGPLAARRRRHPEAGHLRRRAWTSSPRSLRRGTGTATSTCPAARRCRPAHRRPRGAR